MLRRLFGFLFKRRPRDRDNEPFRSRDGETRLDAKPPLSRKARRLRQRRRIVLALKWAVVLTAAGLFFKHAATLWEEEFLAHPGYAVGAFEFSTNGVITPKQVMEVTGLRADQNITRVPLDEVREKLLALPRVKSVDVRRRLPNHLSVRLEERRPVAWLACARVGLRAFDSRGLLLDEDGVAFPCEMVLNEYTTLPVIRMGDLAPVTPGRPVDQLNVRRALELVRRMRDHRWPVPMRLEQVHVINRFTFMAQMDTDAIFTFRPDRLSRQIARLDAILQCAREADRAVASVNLQPERNIPVTFFAGSSQPLTTPARPAPQARRDAAPAQPPRGRRVSGTSPGGSPKDEAFKTGTVGGTRSLNDDERDILGILSDLPSPVAAPSD